MRKAVLFLNLLLYAMPIITNTVSIKHNYAGTPYQGIINAYKNNKAWGLHTTIDLKNCDPHLIRSKEAIQTFVKELCDLIEMKRFGDTTVVHFGEDEIVAGYSMVQLIETSLISGHFANLTDSAYIDIFSCKLYDPYKAAEFTKKFFKGEEYTLNILLRV